MHDALMTDGFSQLQSVLSAFWQNYVLDAQDIAVAVSGGADSMALLHSLAQFSAQRGAKLYAYTVDHALRAESSAEARGVSEYCSGLGVPHKTLVWQHDEKPDARLQEQARAARYGLIAQQMEKDGADFLFLAHHMDDQAETFLFRLAKGSGLDGLSGMQAMAQNAQGLKLCRPFLNLSKGDLYAYCAAHEIPYVEDPSNQNDDFARVRLRQSMAVLEQEGLSAKRLSVTAGRIARAKDALGNISLRAYDKCALVKDKKRIVIKLETFKALEEEIALRVILHAMAHFQEEGGYGARREKVEQLFDDLWRAESFRKRTLGGVIFARDDQGDQILLEKE